NYTYDDETKLEIRRVIFLSVQYLKVQDIQISMSSKGNCIDNACIESFHSTIKRERIFRRQYKTRQEAIMDVLKYIGFYNERRMHSTLDYLSPNEFERAHPGA